MDFQGSRVISDSGLVLVRERDVEFQAREPFLRVGFILTDLETPSRAVVRFYNKRGTAEQWIKEGKQALKMTRFSCHRFRLHKFPRL